MEDSPPHRDLQVEERDEEFLHYVQLRRAQAELVEFPLKSNTFLVAPQIPDHVSLLLDIIPKLTKLNF